MSLCGLMQGSPLGGAGQPGGVCKAEAAEVVAGKGQRLQGQESWFEP